MRSKSLLQLILVFSLALLTNAAKVDSSCLGNENAFAAEEVKIPEISGVGGAMIDSGGGQLKEQQATNPLYEMGPKGPKARSRFGKLVRLIFSRTAKQTADMNKTMTDAHGRLGMDFLVKDKNGAYNKRHKVPVHSPVVPLDAEYYQALNQTTQPYLVASRKFLQAYFSLGPRGKRADYLKQMGLPAKAWPHVKELIEMVSQSIYQLPGLSSRKMKDYPFHTGPIGFDAVLRNLEVAEGIFFEPNKGTPSGISNLTKQLDTLRKVDPEAWEIVREAMVKNETFKQFRESIESAGKAWTGEKGIAVVVGPGEYNGAHPDVASIAMLTGMPLVRAGDLYTGKDGFVRMRTGKGERNGDPKVTAIYSRMEESFLLQEGHSLGEGASPMVQTFVDNAVLGKKLGLKLKAGVYYEYIHEGFDITKPVIDIARDPEGNPKISVSYNRTLGPHPDGTPSGSLRDAIVNKKLFVNNLGARMVDNKRGFSVIHELGKLYAKPGQKVAGPPQSLKRGEWKEQFLDNYDTEKWVVKVDDSSGGDGIYIFAGMTSRERADVANLVRETLAGTGTKDYEIQVFTTSASQTTAEVGRDGQTTFANRMIDLRIFPFFFADGHVEAGSAGMLGRTAPQYDAKANTSAGGGYANIVVLAKKALNLELSEIQPGPVRQEHVSPSAKEALGEFIREAREITNDLAKGPKAVDKVRLKNFSLKTKRVMHLLDWQWQSLRGVAEEYGQGEISYAAFAKDFSATYKEMAAKISSGEDFYLANGLVPTGQAALAAN